MKQFGSILCRKGRAWVTLSVVWIVLFAGCSKKSVQIEAPKTQVPDFTQTQTLSAERQPDWYEGVGVISPVEKALVTARVPGQVVEILLDEGAEAAQGEVLLRLDDRDAVSRVTQAQQGLSAAEAALEEARLNLERVRKLHQKSAATDAMQETAQSAFLQAEAGLGAAEGRLSEAETYLSYHEITAPFDGVLSKRWVKSGDMAWPGKPLAEVYDPSVMEIMMRLPERLKALARKVDVMKFSVPSIDWQGESSELEILPAVDPESRTFVLKMKLPENSDLASGLFAKGRLQTGERSVLKTPAAAVSRVGQLPMVWAQNASGNWGKRWVTLGRNDRTHVEILSGLESGETIGWVE